eukprot:757890-Hanusia_phi.AAC.3
MLLRKETEKGRERIGHEGNGAERRRWLIGGWVRKGRGQDTSTSIRFTTGDMLGRLLTPVEKIATLITCLCHDLFHPGVNSDFLIKSAAPMALEFPAPNVTQVKIVRFAD